MLSICAHENSQSLEGGVLLYVSVLIPKSSIYTDLKGVASHEKFCVFREPVNNFSIKKYMKQIRYFLFRGGLGGEAPQKILPILGAFLIIL